MTRPRVLSKQDIVKAKELKESGVPNRKIAQIFEVGKTTIWDNVYRTSPLTKRKIKPNRVYRYRKIDIVLTAINQMRADGYNSQTISTFLGIPLKEVNVCIEKGYDEFVKQFPNYFE